MVTLIHAMFTNQVLTAFWPVSAATTLAVFSAPIAVPDLSKRNGGKTRMLDLSNVNVSLKKKVYFDHKIILIC